MSLRRRPRVLIVSKPLVPPWNDSSKNLAKDIVLQCKDTDFRVFTSGDYSFSQKNIYSEPLYSSRGDYAPSLAQQMKIFFRLLQNDRDIDLYHFFFAPNPRTLSILQWIFKFKSGKPVIHTLCSQPKSYAGLRRLFFADHVIALSENTKRKLDQEGIRDVSYIPPGIHLDRSTISNGKENSYQALKKTGEFCIFFSGDYEYSGAHSVILESLPLIFREVPNAKIFFACRMKTSQAEGEARKVEQQVKTSGFGDKVHFFKEVPDILNLIRIMDLCIFPAVSLYRKMDIPLVLLECLANQVPLIVSDLPELKILIKNDAAASVPRNDPKALAQQVSQLSHDHHQLSHLKQKGKELVASTFNIERVGAAYESLYDQLISTV